MYALSIKGKVNDKLHQVDVQHANSQQGFICAWEWKSFERPLN